MSQDYKDLIARLRRHATDTTCRLTSEAASAIAALVAERDAAVADAERYRWLQANCIVIIPASQDGPAHPTINFSWDIWAENPGTHNAHGLSAAIDAALQPKA
jgi:hypothetical protein